MSLAELNAGLESIKAAFDALEDMKRSNPSRPVFSKIDDLESALTAVQAQIIASHQVRPAALERIRELGEEVRCLRQLQA